MVLILFLLSVHPDEYLFSKLDSLFEKQVKEFTDKITSPAKYRLNAQQVASLKQELALLQKSFTLTIPMFDFDAGVRVGDIGTIGYYTDYTTNPIPDGRGGVARVSVPFRTVRQAKVARIAADHVNFQLLPPKDGFVNVYNFPKDGLVEDKIVDLNKLIYEYTGKAQNTDTRTYKVLGNESDFAAWKKSKMKR